MIALPSPAMWARKSGSDFRSPCISTNRQPRIPSGRISKTFGVDNSKACAKKWSPIQRAALTSAKPGCTRPQAQQWLEQAAEWCLQVENFDSSLILENRLSAVMGGKMAVGGLRAGVEPFIEQLAAATATPGGGSASAAAAAMAAALGSMVAGMSRGKKAYLQFEGQLSDSIAQLARLREELKAAIDADAESYNSVMKAYKEAKTSSDGDHLIDAALKLATSVPLGVAEKAREVAVLVTALK